MQTRLDSVFALLDRMIAAQEEKVLATGRRFVPWATSEDLRNSEDFPQLKDKPTYHYEEGILAGYLAARTAIAAEIRRSEGEA